MKVGRVGETHAGHIHVGRTGAVVVEVGRVAVRGRVVLGVQNVAGLTEVAVGVVDFAREFDTPAGPGPADRNLVGIGLGHEGLIAGQVIAAAGDGLDLVGAREHGGRCWICADPRQADEELVVIVVAITRVKPFRVELGVGVGAPLGRQIHRRALAVAGNGLSAFGQRDVGPARGTSRAGHRSDGLT